MPSPSRLVFCLSTTGSLAATVVLLGAYLNGPPVRSRAKRCAHHSAPIRNPMLQVAESGLHSMIIYLV
ncbi:hypothetical protein RRG08_031954 [Elysia crispata]|uniref:Uncharacterized protein n=1 Tax=Elysia crispata TaxID=231223 RepID=A0AAE0Z4A3_9GAST|nr:hypothetical protein RRG08_031954 [Elysia crispata]